MLELNGVHAAYGPVGVLKGISLRVEEGEIVTLIGANGAGKSTTLRTISGVVACSAGSVAFQGRRLDGLKPHQVAALGIAHVPEGRRIFPRLTVAENLEMGGYLLPTKAEIGVQMEAMFQRFPRLKERRGQLGGTLSGGEQQMLAIARALMMKPTLLMLDEPSMGLAPTLVEQVFATIRELNAAGVTVLLVEQNAHLALQTAGRGYVLQLGEIILEDRADRLLANAMVREAYLAG